VWGYRESDEKDKGIGRKGDSDLKRNTTNYKYNHKQKYATEIIIHFINVKY